MNYHKVYSQIINRAKTRNLNSYIESHHILPRSLNGSNDKDNLADLTAREHFICHWLLTKMYVGEAKSKMIYAFWRMLNSENNATKHRATSFQYEIARKHFSATT